MQKMFKILKNLKFLNKIRYNPVLERIYIVRALPLKSKNNRISKT
jgi:hypothetical protein